MILVDLPDIAQRRPFALAFERRDQDLFVDVGERAIGISEIFATLQRMHQQTFRGAIVFSLPEFISNIELFSRLIEKRFPRHRILWAIKSAPIPELIRAASSLPIAYEVGSFEELMLVVNEGVSGERICHTGSGKFDWDIDAIVRYGCISISDNIAELALLGEKACELGKRIEVGIRINPSIESHTHSAIATGTADCKFGIPEISPEFLAALKNLSHIDVSILHMHIGSQIASPENYGQALRNLIRAYRLFRKAGFEIQTIDIGGGFPFPYADREITGPSGDHAFSNAIRDPFEVYLERIHGVLVEELGNELPVIATEPGRIITAGSAFAIGCVLHTKQYPNGLRWLISSVNVNDLWLKEITPNLLFNIAFPGKRSEKTVPTAIGGTLCFSGDILTPPGVAVNLPEGIVRGDVLLFANVGAYALLGAGNFHLMPRLPVYLLDAAGELIRARTPA